MRQFFILSILFYLTTLPAFSQSSSENLITRKEVSIYFDFNHSELNNEAKVQLNDFLYITTKSEGYIVDKIQLHAYSDSVGNEAGNLRIGNLRLEKTIQYLQEIAPVITTIETFNHGSSYQRENKIPSKMTRKVNLYFYLFSPKKQEEGIVQTFDEEELKTIDTARTQQPIIHEEKVVEHTQEEKNLKGSTITTFIYFVGDKSRYLYDPKSELERIYTSYQKDTTLHLLIKGHVCCGNYLRLSTKRAKRVYKDLIKLGIPKKKISYEGYGNTEPIVKEINEGSRQKNRRVEVYFY